MCCVIVLPKACQSDDATGDDLLTFEEFADQCNTATEQAIAATQPTIKSQWKISTASQPTPDSDAVNIEVSQVIGLLLGLRLAC